MRLLPTSASRWQLSAATWTMFRSDLEPGQTQVLSDGTRVQIMHNGLRVLADGYCGEWMTQLIARCRGCHEPQESESSTK